MQSDPRKIHIPTFRLSSPVVPMFGSWTAWGIACSATSTLLLVRVPGVRAVVLDREAVHGVERPQPAHHDLDHAHEKAGEHYEKAEGEDQRPVRWGRHVNGGDLGRGHRARPGPRRPAMAAAVLLGPEVVALVNR